MMAALGLAIGVCSGSAAAVVKTIKVGSHPVGVSSDGTHVWVTNYDDGTVSEIDASTGTVVNTINVGSRPPGVSSDGTHVWVTNAGGGLSSGTVSEIDASTATVVNTIPVGSAPDGVSSDGTHVWVTNAGGGTVSEIDASTGTVVNTIPVGYAPQGVSSDGTHVWVVNASGGTVSEIDASTGRVVNTIKVGSRPGPSGVSSDGTHVWVTNYNCSGCVGTVSEIKASTGRVVKTIKVGRDVGSVSSDGTHVWVTNFKGGTVSEIDASTGTVVNTIKVGRGPDGVSSDGTHVWVTNNNGATVSQIQISKAAPVARPCASRQLLISLGPESAASGHLVIPIRFHDRGGTCSLRGYPRVDGLSASGRVVVRAKPALTGFFGSWSIATITLKNGQTASALLQGVDAAFFAHPPPSSRRLRVTPPNASQSVRLRAPYPFADLTIHPVVTGRNGGGRYTAGAAAAHQISAYPEIPFPLSGVGNVWHGNPQVKPSTWLMFADGSWVLEKLKWTGWGTKVAHAAGISSASNGIPSQAQGKRIKKKAKVTLWNPGKVLGKRVYRCFALTLPKQAYSMTDCLENSHGWNYLPTKATPPGTSTTTASPASRWTIQASSGPSGIPDPGLSAVSCVSASFCSAVGSNANYYAQSATLTAFSDTWGGASWSTGTIATGQALNGLSCASDTFCVVVGSTTSGTTTHFAVASTWDGTAWTQSNLPKLSGNSVLNGVACVSTNFCIAVGEHGKSTYPQAAWTQPLTEVWNGSAWSIVKTPSLGGRGGQLAAVTCFTASWCMVLGEYYKGHLGPYPDIPRDQWVAEIWNGRRWTVQHPAAINNQPRLGPDPWNFVTGVGCTSRRSCIGIGYIPITQGDASPTPFAVRWNGHSWSPSRNGLPRFARLNGVSCVDARSCFAAGQLYSNVSGSQSRTAPLIIRWNGSRWTRASIPRTPAQSNAPLQHGALNAIACVPHGACVAVGSQPHGQATTTLIESNHS